MLGIETGTAVLGLPGDGRVPRPLLRALPVPKPLDVGSLFVVGEVAEDGDLVRPLTPLLLGARSAAWPAFAQPRPRRGPVIVERAYDIAFMRRPISSVAPAGMTKPSGLWMASKFAAMSSGVGMTSFPAYQPGATAMKARA